MEGRDNFIYVPEIVRVAHSRSTGDLPELQHWRYCTKEYRKMSAYVRGLMNYGTMLYLRICALLSCSFCLGYIHSF